MLGVNVVFGVATALLGRILLRACLCEAFNVFNGDCQLMLLLTLSAPRVYAIGKSSKSWHHWTFRYFESLVQNSDCMIVQRGTRRDETKVIRAG